MAKSPQQKLKLLRLMEILLSQTDENHPMSVAEMITRLEKYNIRAERKSIYDDLEALRLFGLDVVISRGRGCGYYIGSRDFELPELKLLVDSVQSSKFITQKKTESLIGKIEKLASVYDAELLHRQVYVRNRVKSMNESVYYNVDSISAAIGNNKRIHFRYYEYTIEKERKFRHDGAVYEISPFALIWDDENYYMLGWDAAAARMKHFRVDKMEGIVEGEAGREGKSVFEQMDVSAYSQKVFGMFTGEEVSVNLRFHRHLAGAVMDRFGKEVMLVPDGDEHFTVSVPVVLSPKFYAWVFSFGTEAEILAPERVRTAMVEMLAAGSGQYR
ncbi:MAG: WYL domain-containing protein [Ruminococcaceae bacterium]|nr:WYL domain-containing protein [Oscillospiraceae bacterium]